MSAGDGVDPTTARAAGQVLAREKYLGGDAPATVQLRYADRRYQARSVVRPGAEGSTAADRGWWRHAELLSMECFRSAPVDVHLCDENLATRRVIRFEPVRPDLPVRVTRSLSVGGGSQVARYHNDLDRYLTPAVALTCPTTGTAATTTLCGTPCGGPHAVAGEPVVAPDGIDLLHGSDELRRTVGCGRGFKVWRSGASG